MFKKVFPVIGIVLIILTVAGCLKSKTRQTRTADTLTTSESATAAIPRPDSQGSTFIGECAGTNEEGDFWLLFVKDEQGAQVEFIFDNQIILDRKSLFEGKKIRVAWVWKELEQAGSGEKFRTRFAQSVDVVE